MNYYIILFLSILFFLTLILFKKKEGFISNKGLGTDASPEFNGPFNYDQNHSIGSNESYFFDGPYDYDQNPLL